MSTPSIIGSIQLGIQAIDSANNSVIFNRLINGLLNTNCSDATYTANAFIGTVPFSFFQSARSGFFLMNKAIIKSSDIITLTWTPTGVSSQNICNLAAQAAILLFEPSGLAEIGNPTAVSTNSNGTPVEVAWWV